MKLPLFALATAAAAVVDEVERCPEGDLFPLGR